MDLPLTQIRAAAEEAQAALVDFSQQILRTPSLPGQENEVAPIIRREMEDLGYDDVWSDAAGNIIGKVNGGSGPTVMLNGHMDHVDPGPGQAWPQPPFSGNIVEGELWGRGSVDMKGPVACMMYAVGLLKQLNLTPPGDVYMTVPIMEEIGGLGTQFLITSQLNADVAICGEPSRNTLRLGHRGRVEVQVTFKGRSAHASTPHLAVNPHFSAAAVLTRLSELSMSHNEVLGYSSVAPTLYFTDQISSNVIPSEVRLILDWRNVPDESPNEIVARIQALVNDCLAHHDLTPDGQAIVEITTKEFTTYTGLTKVIPAIFPSYILPKDHPIVQTARSRLDQVLEREVGVDVWPFATDGGHLMAAGIPTIGFGPGDERLAHTNQERISLAQMEEAVIAYVALIFALGRGGNA